MEVMSKAKDLLRRLKHPQTILAIVGAIGLIAIAQRAWFALESAVFAISVACHVRHNHRMVEGSVEDGFVVLALVGDIDDW